ncbi:MAG: AAA family ATPase, partial [Treponema sp.]|nr:AAA family ATPase [Treponema sp.]
MHKGKARIIVKGEDQTDKIRAWKESNGKIHIIYLSGKTYPYNLENVQIKYPAIYDDTTQKCFEYLKRIAQTIGLSDSSGGNILANRYEKVNLNNKSMLSALLTGKLDTAEYKNTPIDIYPFGFNKSQKIAIDRALNNTLTIIEGPPGTGKTQTILNIIANAVIRGESIAIVSSNNSATANVQEKLQKYNIDFISAYLGNSDNKAKFIESQKSLPPNLTSWEITAESKKEICLSLIDLQILISTMLENKNKLSLTRQELE